MRLGFIGPAGSDADALERAARVLIVDFEVDQVVYLGEDDALREFVSRHETEGSGAELEREVARVAATGSPTDIDVSVSRNTPITAARHDTAWRGSMPARTTTAASLPGTYFARWPAK